MRSTMNRLKRVSIALAILGITLGSLLVGWFGWDRIFAAILSVGGQGFSGYIAWQAAVFVLLGIAWWAVVPPDRRVVVFVWGRMVRDAAASCLPFSQVGGFVMGARAVVLCGVPSPLASISTVVDLTAEFVAEILFLIFGLVILMGHGNDMPMALPISIGVAMALLAGLIMMRLQSFTAPLFIRLGRGLLGRWFAVGGQHGADSDLADMYSHTGRFAIGTLLHLLGWGAKGAGNWIAFRLLGHPIDITSALAIEALLHAMLAAAVVVPGYAGVQEAGYVGLGSLFGAAPEISLSVSLLRRARDLALGLPILLAWQAVEMLAWSGKASKP